MNIPRTIFFDLDNTLVDHNLALRLALAATVERFAQFFEGLAFDMILQAFDQINESLWKEYGRGELTPAELRLQRFEALLLWCDDRRRQFSSRDDSDIEEISESYIERYVQETTPYDGVLEMLNALSARHSLGIITNGFIYAQKGKLAACGLDHLFPYMIFSEQVGVQKPDPLIFGAAVRAAGVEPADVLYVGDNFFHDIFGASFAGLKTIWYNPLDHAPTDEHPRIQPDAIVRSIAELAQLLGVPLQSNSTQ